MRQSKKVFPLKKSFDGTGFCSRISFGKKVYGASILFLAAIFILGAAIGWTYQDLFTDSAGLKRFHRHITTNIQFLKERSPLIISRCQSGLLNGNGLDVSAVLTGLDSAIRDLQADFKVIDGKSLTRSYRLLRNRLFLYNKSGLTETRYLEIQKLYRNYFQDLSKLEKMEDLYYRGHLWQPLRNQLWILIPTVLLITLFLFGGCLLLISAVRSIVEPAELMTETFTSAQRVFNVFLPISSADGLGKAGLLFKESLSHMGSAFVETKNTIQRFEALCKEFVTEIRKTELFAIQVQQVAELVVSNLKDQERLISQAKEEFAYLENQPEAVWEISSKIGDLLGDCRAQLMTAEDQTKGILKRPVTYPDASGMLNDLAENLADTSVKIGETIKIFEDVAERTQLLALNTAIQAARAGEKGLGFGVVAKEISKLVDNSKKASWQLNQLLHETQVKNGQILNLINNRPAPATDYQQVEAICEALFEKARGGQEVISQITKAVEATLNMLGVLLEETAVISVLAEQAINSEHYNLEVLDYQLNVKEANRVALNISEKSEELRKLVETAANEPLFF
ncbi:MAG: methyl-accepting chemotaxis protein [Bacillota bacterium]